MEVKTVKKTTLSIYGVLSRVRSRRMDGQQQNAGQRGMNPRSKRRRRDLDYNYLHKHGGDEKRPIVFHDQQDDEPVQEDAGAPMSPGMQANAEAYAANVEQQQQQSDEQEQEPEQVQQPEEQEQEPRPMQRERQREKEPQEPMEQNVLVLSGTRPAEFRRMRCIPFDRWYKEQQEQQEREEQRKKKRKQPEEQSTAVGGSAK